MTPSPQSMYRFVAERTSMEKAIFVVNSVRYELTEDKPLSVFLLKSNGEYPSTIIICKLYVTLPDGREKVMFRYSPKDIKGAADIAAADCATKYLEELYNK